MPEQKPRSEGGPEPEYYVSREYAEDILHDFEYIRRPPLTSAGANGETEIARAVTLTQSLMGLLEYINGSGSKRALADTYPFVGEELDGLSEPGWEQDIDLQRVVGGRIGRWIFESPMHVEGQPFHCADFLKKLRLYLDHDWQRQKVDEFREELLNLSGEQEM